MALLDIYYVEQWSPALDLKIFLRTIPTVLFGDGAYWYPAVTAIVI
jgi:lipopolysaccharide/colanic/teichoic acid biosynthesis glycosyltransferase